MNSKARVHAALKREPVDRVPIFMWFHPETAVRLARVLEIPPARLSDAMGDDIRQTWVGNNYAMEGITHEHDGESHTDAWGIEWVKDGPFNQIRRYPLRDVGDEEILGYQHPYRDMEFLLRRMDPVMERAGEFFVGCDVSPCLFELLCRLRGMENAIVDLAANPSLATAMLQKAGDFSCRISEAACQCFALDWLWTGDDVGGQQSLIMSPDCWRELIKPHLARIVQVGRSRGLWVAYHSCGAIHPIIPDLIEIGLNVLNPIQCNGPGMNPYELKKEFGKRLAFMGGIDTQELLPKGTTADVRRETERLLAAMTADGGGYILAASHTIPPETPIDNIFALYAAAGVSREEIMDRAAEVRKKSGEHPISNVQ